MIIRYLYQRLKILIKYTSYKTFKNRYEAHYELKNLQSNNKNM